MLAVCCLGVLVVGVNISSLAVGVPAIRHDLHASRAGVQVAVDVYPLALASFVVAGGSAADRFGRRRVFGLGLVVFAVGSLGCALAPGIGVLIASRIVQAGGATMINPVAIAIIATTFPERAERARAIGVFASAAGLALALGPTLGGALVEVAGWRAVFWADVPTVAAATAAAALVVPASRAGRARRFDPVGQVMVILVLGGLVFAITNSPRHGWSWPPVLAAIALAALGLLGIGGYEPRRVDPLLELRLFSSVPFSAAIVTAVTGLCAFSAFLLVTTGYLYDVRHLSALSAGLSLTPVAALTAVISPLSGRVLAVHGPRLPLLAAGTALTLGGLASLRLTPATPLPAALAAFLLFGLFLGAVNPPITTTAISGMPTSMAGVAGALASTGRQTGTTVGVAIAGAIMGSASSAAAYTNAEHHLWWLVLGIGIGITIGGLLSTGRRARETADRTAALFTTQEEHPPTGP